MKKLSTISYVLVCLLFPVMARADALVLSGADIVPTQDNTLYSKGNNYMYLGSGSPNNFFIAPVHLPQGAKVTSVVVFYEDSDATGALEVTMVKTNLYSGAYSVMATWESSGTPGLTSYKISPILGGNTIDNNGYSYTFLLNFTSDSAGNNVRLYKIKVNYN